MGCRKKGGEKIAYNSTIPAHVLLGQAARGSTTEEVMQNAGLNFSVGMEPIYTKTGKEIRGNFRRVVREDNDFTLGVVGKNYHVLQPQEMFDIADNLVGKNMMDWERVGSLKGGAKIFGSFVLPDHVTVGDGDKSAKRIYLSNTNDGSGSLRVLPVLDRLVCRNQTAMVEANMRQWGINKRDLTIRHSSKMHERIDDLKNALKVFDHMADQWAREANMLMTHEMEIGDRIEFYIDALDMKPREELVHKVDNPHGLATNSRNRLAAVLELETAKTNTIGGISDTPMQAFNTLTEYVDHASILKRNGDVRQTTVENTVFGNGARQKGNAWARLVDAYL